MLRVILLIFVLFNLSFAYKLDKNTINSLNIKEDKIYILNFFASWCVSCKEELPILSQMKLSKEIKIIGINVDEEKSEGLSFVNSLNLKFKIVYDTNNEIISKFDPIGVPAIYFIKNLEVKKSLFGAVKHIDKVIQKNIIVLEN